MSAKPTQIPVVGVPSTIISLLVEYQTTFTLRVPTPEGAHRVVADLWNSLFTCTTKKGAVLYLKNGCHWSESGHELLGLMARIWVYQPSIKYHEAHFPWTCPGTDPVDNGEISL